MALTLTLASTLGPVAAAVAVASAQVVVARGVPLHMALLPARAESDPTLELKAKKRILRAREKTKTAKQRATQQVRRRPQRSQVRGGVQLGRERREARGSKKKKPREKMSRGGGWEGAGIARLGKEWGRLAAVVRALFRLAPFALPCSLAPPRPPHRPPAHDSLWP